MSASVERITTWPENGSSFNRKSKPASSLSSSIFQATSAPGARFVAISVCRMRRIVPAASIARSRSCTYGDVEVRHARDLGERIEREIRRSRSSDTARIRALIGSVISAGTAISSMTASICEERSMNCSQPKRARWSARTVREYDVRTFQWREVRARERSTRPGIAIASVRREGVALLARVVEFDRADFDRSALSSAGAPLVDGSGAIGSLSRRSFRRITRRLHHHRACDVVLAWPASAAAEDRRL